MVREVQAVVGQNDAKWDRQFTLAELITAQAQDPSCQQYVATIGPPKLKFNINGNGRLVRQSTIDGAFRAVVPRAIQKRLAY